MPQRDDVPFESPKAYAEYEGRMARLWGRALLDNPYDGYGAELVKAWEFGWLAEDKSLRTGE